jgi:hypothetical protein
VEFRKEFLDGEAEDEQVNAIENVLDSLKRRYGPASFQGRQVANYAGGDDPEAISFKASLEMAANKALPVISAPAITWRLKAIKDRPVKVGDKTLVLRFMPDHEGGSFRVETLQ